ncbi:MAG TPA: hypothetical protein VHE78_08610 [Gemmatimonadaceae bacterium]|nr:hypothetical protein [Gemmatimonadaceae bacterium]
MTRRSLAALVAGFVCAGCSGESVTSTPAAIALSLSAASTSVVQGSNATITVMVTRTNFAGDVQLSVEQLPEGVTASFSPSRLTGGQTQSTLTLAASMLTRPATTSLTVRATGAGVGDAPGAMSLTVAPAPVPPNTYVLSLEAATLAVASTQRAPITVRLARTVFTGPVTLAVTGLPAGVTATFAPNPTLTEASVLTIDAGAAPPGTYTVTVTGTSPGLADRAATLALTITNAATVTLQFCDGRGAAPLWVAYQNGGGPWTRVTSADGNYHVSIIDKGGVAFVSAPAFNPSNPGTEMKVVYGTAAELNFFGKATCGGAKTVYGSVIGRGAGEMAEVALGSAVIGVSAPLPFTLSRVPTGPLDLLATVFDSSVYGASEEVVAKKVVIRRGLDPADRTTLAPIDFSSAEAIPTTRPTLSFSGAGDGADISVRFRTQTGSNIEFGYYFTYGSTPYAAVPASALATGDRFDFYVIPTEQRGGLFASYSNPVDHSFALGPPLRTPTIATIGVPAVQVRVLLPSQREYGGFAQVQYSQAIGRYAWVTTTAAYSAGMPATWTLDLPDLSGVAGFQSAWALASGTPTQYYVVAGGDYLFKPTTDGAQFGIGATFGTTQLTAGSSSAGSALGQAAPLQSRSRHARETFRETTAPFVDERLLAFPGPRATRR